MTFSAPPFQLISNKQAVNVEAHTMYSSDTCQAQQSLAQAASAGSEVQPDSRARAMTALLPFRTGNFGFRPGPGSLLTQSRFKALTGLLTSTGSTCIRSGRLSGKVTKLERAELLHVFHRPLTNVDHLFGISFAQSRARIRAAVAAKGIIGPESTRHFVYGCK